MPDRKEELSLPPDRWYLYLPQRRNHMSNLTTSDIVESAVRQAVAQTIVTDIHTHLFPPSHGDLLLWGIDELLTYHYLVAELFIVAPRDLTPEKFWKFSKTQQADLVWHHVFIRHGGLSESARGLLSTLSALGLDVAGRNLAEIRGWFAQQSIDEYLPKVFELTRIDYAVMTNNPFAPAETAHWMERRDVPECFRSALRIDTLILNWPAAAAAMRKAGYATSVDPDEASFAVAREFLTDWSERIAPIYMAASLPPQFAYPREFADTAVLDNVVLPVARELNLPVAMMIGVRKAVNPALGDAGDAVGIADGLAVQNLCRGNPDVKFLVTMLSRVNHHELCVLARKFDNLHVFGCWWFCNTPSIIEEVTRMRMELLGATFTCQHSDVRVLDQLIYKWEHTRAIVADVLADTYRQQFATGWRPTEEEIRRDVRALFGGAFEDFCAK